MAPLYIGNQFMSLPTLLNSKCKAFFLLNKRHKCLPEHKKLFLLGLFFPSKTALRSKKTSFYVVLLCDKQE